MMTVLLIRSWFQNDSTIFLSCHNAIAPHEAIADGEYYHQTH
jgi:hypothetical protein